MLCVLFLLCTDGLELDWDPERKLYSLLVEVGVRALKMFYRKPVLTSCSEDYTFVEFFAGQSNLTWALQYVGFRGLRVDAGFGGRYNNIFDPAGMA